jgi:hypothetical protein
MSNRDSVQNQVFHLLAGLSLVRSSGASSLLSRAFQSGFPLCPDGFPRGVPPAPRAPLPCAGTRLIGKRLMGSRVVGFALERGGRRARSLSRHIFRLLGVTFGGIAAYLFPGFFGNRPFFGRWQVYTRAPRF